MGFSNRFAHQSLGLRANRGPGEWYKIGREQLVPHIFYDIRVTANCWEVQLLRYLRSMTVDHPRGTEILVE